MNSRSDLTKSAIVCFLCAGSEGIAATLRHGLYQLTTESHWDIHSLEMVVQTRSVLTDSRPPRMQYRTIHKMHQIR